MKGLSFLGKSGGNLKAVLWDKDGTLADSFSAWVGIERILAGRLGDFFLDNTAARETYVRKVLTSLGVGTDGRVSSRGLLASGTEGAILQAFQTSLVPLVSTPPGPPVFEARARKELAEILKNSPPKVKATPGALGCLEFLESRGIPQGLATSDTLANARRDLESLDLDRFIRFWACADNSHRSKPDPWAVQAFALALGLQPSDILVVGDTPADLVLAQSAGASFLALACGTGLAEDFPPGTPVLADPGELHQFLGSTP